LRFHQPTEFREVINRILRIRHGQAGHGLLAVTMAYDVNDQFSLAKLDPVTISSLFNWSLDWSEMILTGALPNISHLQQDGRNSISASPSRSIATPSNIQNPLREANQLFQESLRSFIKSAEARLDRLVPKCKSSPPLIQPMHSLNDINSALTALRFAVGNELAQFKSPEQQTFLSSALDGRNKVKDRVYILATASGKSLGPLSCAFQERLERTSRVTVFVVPLFALCVEMEARFSELGFKVKHFQGFAADSTILNDVEIVIITPEVGNGNLFLKYLKNAAERGRLGTIWVDEISTCVTWYLIRPNMIKFIRGLSRFHMSSLSFLTGTCPLSMERLLTNIIGIRDLHFVRLGTSNRPRVHLLKCVVDCNQFPPCHGLDSASIYTVMLVAKVITNLRIIGSDDFRGILYCSTTREVEILYHYMVELLGECADMFYYHGKLSTEDKTSTMVSWLSYNSKPGIMIATSAFGLGMI